jgi:hypothetical protein
MMTIILHAEGKSSHGCWITRALSASWRKGVAARGCATVDIHYSEAGTLAFDRLSDAMTTMPRFKQPTFVCMQCGRPMIIPQTFARDQSIRAPPQESVP